MSQILVFTESLNGQLKRSSQELLQFASRTGQKVIAIVTGQQAQQISQQAAHHGAKETIGLSSSDFDQYNSELFTAAVAHIIEQTQSTIVLASASSLGRDLFPRVAAKTNSGLASDCIELNIQGDQVTAKKPMYSGKCFATAQFENCKTKIVLMRANQLPVTPADTSQSASYSEAQKPNINLKTLIKEIVKGASEKLDLTEANIIVAGGRGLKEAGNFKLLNDLADVLGATVGASRAVVDAGWVGHGLQVGQTGKTVAPSLYIAVGISGAIQHLAGMSGSKVIVAINSDPNAPIFQKATYGIVGDALQVLPQLTEEFKKALQH